MKKIQLLIILTFMLFPLYSIDGFFIGYKGGFLLKVDVASAFQSKRVIDEDKKKENSIPTGMGQYGNTNPHNFPRVVEAKTAPYGDMVVFWGYKFPKLFSLGFGVLLSNLVMPSLMFDYKFSFREDKRIRPYVFIDIYGGLFDGFPIGLYAGGGMDIFLNQHFFFLIESKLGAEIFVSQYYDDGNNSNPIWHWDSVYAYAGFAIYLGLGYQFKNKWTDENGKWLGNPRKRKS
ncbi:MAG: hypothetical protein MJB14_12550 [Spirochaetes bacterium]|nr:hypothetical protein [Spirochaetota bacterium]